MRYFILFCLIFLGSIMNAQVYTVNSSDDVNDGVCDGVHCSLREAILASEADGVPSTINFNIPGAGPMSINPTGPFPTVIQNDLTILGETQPGGPGSIVIDFNYRNFGGIGFWDVLGNRFYISGIDFTDFLFDNVGDHLFQFGDPNLNSSDSRIYNCSFITDNSSNPGIVIKKLINIFRADNLSISNNYFGTDHALSSIFKLEGYIYIDGNQGAGKVTIDSNIFVNKIKMIEWSGGNLSVDKNIFGALDTSKAANFLDPQNAILGVNPVMTAKIDDNFFFGFKKSAISTTAQNNITISKNKFNNNIQDIFISGQGNDVITIADNFARNGRWFLSTNGINEINVERNNISLYDTVFYNQNDPLNQKIRHIDNRMTCINDEAVVMDPALFPSHAIPIITSVNRNQITGTGIPNDSVVVYSNNRISCPNTICEAGVEIGRTRANGAGNWVLNAAYPNKTTITAYQFDSNPNKRPTLYSEFSPCYQCAVPVKIVFNPSLCTGQSITYRGKVYSSLNPNDSIIIKGDAVSICDSVIVVRVNNNLGYRTQLNLPVCYQDTLRFGPVIIHKNHLNDSLLLKSVSGCDSIITITGHEVGLKNFSQTICDNASVTIGGTRFDKNNTSGTATITGAAEGGCDSIVFVNLTINNFTEFFLNRNMCPGQNINVGGQLFDQLKPSGDVTLPNGSSTGCDSVIHVNLTYPNNVGSFASTICSEDSIQVGNKYFFKTNPSGQVTLVGGSSFGCDSIVNVSIIFFPIPQGNYTTKICKGDSIFIIDRFFSEKNTNAVVTIPNASGKGCDSLVNVSVTLFAPAQGNYNNQICKGDSVFIIDRFFSDRVTSGIVTIQNASINGCDSTVNVNISLLPNAQGNYSNQICRGDTLNLNGELFFSGKTTGSIQLTNVAANGCDSVVLVNISIIPDAIGSFDTTMCDNQSLTLYGQTFSILRPRGALKIPKASFRMCDSFLNVNITFVPESVGNFSKTICRKDNVKVGNQTFDSGNLSGVVRLVGGSSAGCDSVVNVSLTIYPSILLNAAANDLKCNQANTGELVLNDITGGSGNFKVSIDNGAPLNYNQGQILGNLSQGNHTIRIIDQMACDTSYNFTINNSQILSLQLPNDTIIKKGSVVNINALVNFNPSLIVWDPPTFLDCINCLNPQSIPDQTITYTLTVTDANGCTISDNLTITVIVDQADIYVPNAFSPNGDNINDFFKPEFKFPDKTAITVFRIFDRWGNLQYEHLDGKPLDVIYWDGTRKGEKLNPGVYVYAIQFVGEDNVAKWKTGDIALIR